MVTLISKWFHEVKAPTIQSRAWKFNSALIFIWKEMWSFAIVKVLNVFVIWRNIQNTPYLHVIFAYKKKYKIRFDKSFCCVHQKYNYVVSFSIPLQKSSHQTKTWNSHNVDFAYKKQSEILFNLFFIRDLHVVSCFMLFLIHDHFINPKIELIIIKHLFWLQKEVKNHIRISDMFLWSVTLQLWVVSLLFLIHGHFIRKKTEKRNIPFLVTKRRQKSYQICFFDLRPRNCGISFAIFDS